MEWYGAAIGGDLKQLYEVVRSSYMRWYEVTVEHGLERLQKMV